MLVLWRYTISFTVFGPPRQGSSDGLFSLPLSLHMDFGVMWAYIPLALVFEMPKKKV
jgi:hypothetical protein